LRNHQKDPVQARLNILDILKMVDVQRSLMYIELGWHLSVLEERILPTIRHYQSLNERCLAAFQALQRCSSLTDYVNLPYQQSQEPVLHLRKKYSAALAAYKEYEVLGQTYCANPIPLLTGRDDNVVNTRYVVPIYKILN